jgi:hypothetical protein
VGGLQAHGAADPRGGRGRRLATSKRGENKRKKHDRHRQGVEARRRAEAQAQEVPDARSIFADVTAQDGVPVSEETLIVVIEPITLPSGAHLWFQSPHVQPFHLIEARRLRDAAEPKRIEAITRTVRTPDGSLRPVRPAAVFDALHGLAVTAILCAMAIEAYANDAIRRLRDDAMVEVPTRLNGQTVPVMRNKASMDRLPIGDKLTRVLPLLTGRDSIKGTTAWQDFGRINRLRNDLVHMQPEALNDPAKPGPFGRLMLGEASKAPEDAASVIDALEPEWFPERLRAEFGLPPQPAAQPAGG